jgi:hypothetical protein
VPNYPELADLAADLAQGYVHLYQLAYTSSIPFDEFRQTCPQLDPTLAVHERLFGRSVTGFRDYLMIADGLLRLAEGVHTALEAFDREVAKDHEADFFEMRRLGTVLWARRFDLAFVLGYAPYGADRTAWVEEQVRTVTAQLDETLHEGLQRFFPELRPALRDQNGETYYSLENVAEALGMSMDEAREHAQACRPKLERLGGLLTIYRGDRGDELGAVTFPGVKEN